MQTTLATLPPLRVLQPDMVSGTIGAPEAAQPQWQLLTHAEMIDPYMPTLMAQPLPLTQLSE